MFYAHACVTVNGTLIEYRCESSNIGCKKKLTDANEIRKKKPDG